MTKLFFKCNDLEPNVGLLQSCKIANSFISSKFVYLYKQPWARNASPTFVIHLFIVKVTLADSQKWATF